MYGGFDLLDHSLLVPDNIHSQKREAAVNYISFVEFCCF